MGNIAIFSFHLIMFYTHYLHLHILSRYPHVVTSVIITTALLSSVKIISIEVFQPTIFVKKNVQFRDYTEWISSSI